MNAALLISFCLGNIVGPLTFRQDGAPEYDRCDRRFCDSLDVAAYSILQDTEQKKGDRRIEPSIC